MNATTIQHSIEHDNLFEKYGGTLSNKKVKEPRSGFRAVIEYVRTTGESLPLSADRMYEIDAILLSKRKAQ